MFKVLSLAAILRYTSLALQLLRLPSQAALLFFQVSTILRHALLLLLDQLCLPLPGKPLLLHLQGSFALRLLLVRFDLELALPRALLFLTAQFLDGEALLLFLSTIDFLLALILRPLLILLNLSLQLLGPFALLLVQLLPVLVRETLRFGSLAIQFLLTLLLRALPILFHLARLLLGALALFSAQFLLALLSSTLLLHLLFAPEVPLTLLLPAALFHLPLLLLSLRLAVLLLFAALFHGTTRLRALWATNFIQ